MRWVLSTFLILAIALFALVMWVDRDEIQSRRFATFADARNGRAIEQGWLPAFTPADARNIQFEYDLDSGTVDGSFIAEDTASIRKVCQPRKSVGASAHEARLLSASIDSKSNRGQSDVFDCRADGFSVAIQSADKRVSYWASPRGE